MIVNEYKKFDIWMADLSGVVGCEQGGIKPCLIISNNIGNKFSPVVTVAILTSRTKKPLPTHVYLNAELNGLDKESLVMLEQVRTVDKNRLFLKVARLHPSLEREVNNAIKISLDTEDELFFVDRNNTNSQEYCFA